MRNSRQRRATGRPSSTHTDAHARARAQSSGREASAPVASGVRDLIAMKTVGFRADDGSQPVGRNECTRLQKSASEKVLLRLIFRARLASERVESSRPTYVPTSACCTENSNMVHRELPATDDYHSPEGVGTLEGSAGSSIARSIDHSSSSRAFRHSMGLQRGRMKQRGILRVDSCAGRPLSTAATPSHVISWQKESSVSGSLRGECRRSVSSEWIDAGSEAVFRKLVFFLRILEYDRLIAYSRYSGINESSEQCEYSRANYALQQTSRRSFSEFSSMIDWSCVRGIQILRNRLNSASIREGIASFAGLWDLKIQDFETFFSRILDVWSIDRVFEVFRY